jgi:hypothetical protein
VSNASSRMGAMLALSASLIADTLPGPVRDYFRSGKGPTPNRYKPHQGERERARRRNKP